MEIIDWKGTKIEIKDATDLAANLAEERISELEDNQKMSRSRDLNKENAQNCVWSKLKRANVYIIKEK